MITIPGIYICKWLLEVFGYICNALSGYIISNSKLKFQTKNFGFHCHLNNTIQFFGDYNSADFEEKLFFVDRIYAKEIKLRIENP